MAKELSITASMTFAKGSTTARMGRGGVLADVAGTKVADLVQEIGTSAEALMLGDISTPGYVLIENLDATNPVNIRAAAGGTNLIVIPPNTTAGPFKFATGSTPHAIADTAPVKIRYLLVEA